jgi:hypothetical protein
MQQFIRACIGHAFWRQHPRIRRELLVRLNGSAIQIFFLLVKSTSRPHPHSRVEGCIILEHARLELWRTFFRIRLLLLALVLKGQDPPIQLSPPE